MFVRDGMSDGSEFGGSWNTDWELGPHYNDNEDDEEDQVGLADPQSIWEASMELVPLEDEMAADRG